MTTVCVSRIPTSRGSLETYLRDIQQAKLLSGAEEKDLAYRISDGDSEAREQLIRANLRLVVTIARTYSNRNMELADMIAEGNMGLMRAAESFDPEMNTRFSTYAVYWIRQSIKRAIINTANTIRVPAYMNDLMTKWRRAVRHLQNTFGQPPTDEEVGALLKLSPRQLKIIRKAIRVYNAAPQTGQEAEEVSQDDVFLDPKAPDAGAGLMDTETLDQVLALIERMDEREASVLRLRFGLEGQEPCTLKEIGDRLGLTRERVRQIEKLALQRLAEEVHAR